MEEAIYKRQVAKISMARRVVDEHQMNRHFKRNDLEELYSVANVDPKDNTCNTEMPDDDILTHQLTKFKNIIYNYHSHDAYLENTEEEDLSPEERQLAWDEYKCEKSKDMKSQLNIKFPCLQIGNVQSPYL